MLQCASSAGYAVLPTEKNAEAIYYVIAPASMQARLSDNALWRLIDRVTLQLSTATARLPVGDSVDQLL
eukprot:gene9773-7655_t